MKKILNLLPVLFCISIIGMEPQPVVISAAQPKNPVTQRKFLDAVNKGNINEVNRLLETGAIDVNDIDDRVLLFASQINSLPMLKRLLEIPNLDINRADIRGNTPLMYAVKNRNPFLVAELLKRPEILVNAVDNVGSTALDIALVIPHITIKREIIDMLRKRGAKTIDELRDDWKRHAQMPQMPIQQSAIIPAAAQPISIAAAQPSAPVAPQATLQLQFFDALTKGNTDEVNRLLETGAINVNEGNPRMGGKPPLGYAIKINSLPMVSHLLQIPNLNVNWADINGVTPLMYAVDKRSPEIVAELLKKPNIQVNAVDNSGSTALDRAVNISRINIRDALVIMLRNRGAKKGVEVRSGAAHPIPAAAQPMTGHKRKEIESERGDK